MERLKNLLGTIWMLALFAALLFLAVRYCGNPYKDTSEGARWCAAQPYPKPIECR